MLTLKPVQTIPRTEKRINDFLAVRKATAEDIDSIFTLVNDAASHGLMLARSKFRLCGTLANFLVATSSIHEVIGCGALVPLWVDLAEIVSLAVRAEYRGQGVGRMLVGRLVDECSKLRICTVMTLTYQVEFFKQQGFTVADKDDFPRKLWRECLDCPKLEHCDEIAMKLEVTRTRAAR
jgi:amino-acid N-acetyltransferase